MTTFRQSDLACLQQHIPGKRRTALVNAIRFGYDGIAEQLLQHKADPNRADISHWTPLMYAAWKDNADQVTTTATVLVALPRTAAPTVMPVAGMTVKVDSVDDNGLSDFSESTLRILHTRRSGLSFGIVMDCSEMVGRTNG